MSSRQVIVGVAAWIVLGCFLGTALSGTGIEENARLGPASRVEWEYKVVGDAFQTVERPRMAINTLAAEGWEYVGPTRLFDGRHDCSVFRKPKENK